MECPKCKEFIDKVWVISEASQPCNLDSNEVDGYGNVELGKTIRIECWNCGEDISELVK